MISPCIKLCAIDPDTRPVRRLRPHAGGDRQWASYSDEERRRIMRALPERLAGRVRATAGRAPTMSRPPRLFFWLLLLLVAAGVAALAVMLAPSFGFDMSSGGPVRLVYFVALLLFVGSAVVGRGIGAREVLRAVLGWGAILIVLVGAYAYRVELAGVGGRLLGVLVPGIPISGAAHRRRRQQRRHHAQRRRPFRRARRRRRRADDDAGRYRRQPGDAHPGGRGRDRHRHARRSTSACRSRPPTA